MPITSGSDMRKELLAGVDVVADAVRVTLGPRGHNVAMPQKANLYGADYGDPAAPGAPTLITNDGVAIARGISLPDPVQNMGAQLLKEAAIAANDEAGDGTTTTIVLAQAILHDAARAIAAGADPLAIRRGIMAAAPAAKEALRASARPVRTAGDIAQVASMSCQDAEAGGLIGQALDAVGAEGVVNVGDSKRLETWLDVQQGIVFERGLLSPHMATDKAQAVAELHNPYILLTDAKLTSRQDLIPALMCAAEDDRPCLVVCDGIEGDAMALVLGSKREGDMDVVCVMAPAYGEGRRWRMDDLAVQTGGAYITAEAGLSLRDVTRDQLGAAEFVRVTAKQTVIQGGAGDAAAIEDRVKQLRHYVENTDYGFNRERHRERLAKFVSGVATIHVGGATEPEQWERRMRVEDAVNAARAACGEGVVAGGGAALLAAAPAVEDLAAGLSGDERAGALIAAAALRAPARQIAENAGADGAAVLARLAEAPAGTGYDASAGRFVDMARAGIVDPLRVTRGALEAAFSIAGTMLLIQAGVADTPQLRGERARQAARTAREGASDGL